MENNYGTILKTIKTSIYEEKSKVIYVNQKLSNFEL